MPSNWMKKQMSEFKHVSVLLTEAVDSLEIKADHWYIDATAGGGGHTQEIVERGGRVLAIDQDDDALAHLKTRFEITDLVKVAKGNFREIETIALLNGIDIVAGVLFDLGMSSFQLDSSGRGFSFRYDEPLDMRMDKANELTARKIVNDWHRDELVDLFLRFGEEEKAEVVADAIVEARHEKKFETTQDLVRVIETVVKRTGKMHPATKVFQALRIAVNSELESLRDALNQSTELLEPGGRIVVISFHSLEDRIVKNMFRQWEHDGKGRVVTKKPIMANEQETVGNVRARSAKMRVFEMR